MSIENKNEAGHLLTERNCASDECRCGILNSTIHFIPAIAISGGSIKSDWERHWNRAALVGCDFCGIEPTVPVTGSTTEERYAEYMTRTEGTHSASAVPETVAGADGSAASNSTGSHSLVRDLTPRPLSIDTRGTDYPLPQFNLPNPAEFKGLRALMLLADGGELPEIVVPLEYLRARGAKVDVVGQNWIFEYREPAGAIVLAQWMSDGYVIKADKKIADVDVSQYDLLIVPGGAWNPIMLSTDGDALRLVRQARKNGLLIASLCHGPQVIAHAAFDAPAGEENFPSDGVEITAAGDVRLLLRLAGFTVLSDQPTVYDESANLLTSRDPNDLQAFCQEIGRLMSERRLSWCQSEASPALP